MPTPRAMLAEFVGTFALMFVGGGAIVVNAALDGGGSGLVGVALAHGLILGVMVSATMHVSGGQLNPAVSIALAVIREQPWPRAAAFVVTQVLGATAAAALLAGLLGQLAAAGGVSGARGTFAGNAARAVRLDPAVARPPAWRMASTSAARSGSWNRQLELGSQDTQRGAATAGVDNSTAWR